MATAPIAFRPPTAWSASRYNDYQKCPAFFKYKHLLKMPEPGNAAMQRGSDIHLMAEKHIKGEGSKLPVELKEFAALFKTLRALFKKKTLPMIVEDQWAFTKDWLPTQWNDWVNCWVRIKLDCAHYVEDGSMEVIDWKTGKFRDDKNAEYMQQLELYALSALVLHPDLKRVRPRLVYLDVGVTYPQEPIEYTRNDIAGLQKLWAGRVKPMFNDKTWKPTPNFLCKYCHYRKSNNGPCQY